HHAFRVLRRRHPEALPLTAAEETPTNSRRHTETPVSQEAFERAVKLLTAPGSADMEGGNLLETGSRSSMSCARSPPAAQWRSPANSAPEPPSSWRNWCVGSAAEPTACRCSP